MGTIRGLEAEVVPKEGLEFRAIQVEGMPRRVSLELPRFSYLLAKGYRQSLAILRDFAPDVVVGMGGFVAAPVLFAARRRNLPILIHEQNSVVGVANRTCGRFASAVAVTYPGTEEAFPDGRARLVGNPVRSRILELDTEGARARFGLEEKRSTLLVFGGSRGAQRINDAVLGGLPGVAREAWLQILHVAGKMDFERVRRESHARDLGTGGLLYRCVPYIDEMGAAYAASDLVVSRAGATSIAEVTALGIASILVPYPYATANHQEKNARFVERAGGARVILNDELDSARLFGEAIEILKDQALLDSMRVGAASFGRPHAREQLADMVFDLVEGK